MDGRGSYSDLRLSSFHVSELRLSLVRSCDLVSRSSGNGSLCSTSNTRLQLDKLFSRSVKLNASFKSMLVSCALDAALIGLTDTVSSVTWKFEEGSTGSAVGLS